MDAPAPAAPTAPRAGLGRLRRWLLLGFVALVALVALAPLFLGPFLRGFVVDALEGELDARARVQTVSFAWPARLEVRGLELSDAGGAPLASLDSLRARLELWALLGGEFRGELELEYPELHVSRAADGRWNWERALAKAKPARKDERERRARDESVPEVRAHVSVADGHVLIHAPEGDTTLSDITLALDVEDLARPAPFHFSMGVRGPGGPAGNLALEGSFTAASNGRIDVMGFAGELKVALEELDLSGFAPALSLVAPAASLGGVLSGKAELGLGAGLALVGQGDFDVRDLTLLGPRPGGEPVHVARIELHGRAAQQGEGAGDQHLELSADSFLKLSYDGRSNAPARGAGEVTGALELEADLARLSEVARGWVPLQAGVALAGRVESGLELTATLADRRPTLARVQARSGIRALAARDASGRALDLSGLDELALELVAAADLEHGTLSVPTLVVRAGPVSCEGKMEATGFALGAYELQSGSLRVQADLEALRGTLAQLVALGDLPFGGRLDADATLSGTGGTMDLAAKLDARALVLGTTSLADLHAELAARRAEDGVLSGTGKAKLGALALRAAGRPTFELPGATLDLALREDAAGHGEHALAFATSDGAVKLALQAKSERKDSDLALESSFTLDGLVAALAQRAAPFVPMQPGLSGNLHASGQLRARAAAGALASAGGRLEAALTELAARDAAGKPLRLEALEHTTLVLEGELDPAAHGAELRTFELTAAGLGLRGSGRVTGLGTAPRLEDGKLALDADLARLGPELARVADLAGWSVAGSPLHAEMQLSSEVSRVEASGRLAVASVRLERPAEAPIALSDVHVDFDLGYDTALGSLRVRSASARSAAGEVRADGTLNELLTPERAHGAMHLELTGELARLLADLGLETKDSGRHTSGTLGAKFAVEGDGGAFRVTGKSTLDDFRLELAPATADQAPLVVEERRITLDCAANVTLANLDVELSKLALESELARGVAEGRIENLRALTAEEGEVRFVGLKGQLAYVPDRLGAVLAPLLPGKLSGAEEQRVHFTLDGHARDFDLATVLASSQARVDLGIGKFTRPEIQLDGALVMETKGEKLLVRGDLGANGGTLQLDGELDLAHGGEPPRSKLTVTAKAVRANAGLAPLLALVHPAFAVAPGGSFDGLIGLGLDLAYDAPLSLEALGAGWKALPKEPLHGMGRLEVTSAAVRGSVLLGLLTSFGVDPTKTLDMHPIEFTIEKGRVTYAKPWTWNLAGTPTDFTGSLGLDESLDLAWNVPITDALVERWGFLSSLKGERLSIPLRGTVRAPRLESDELLKDLAAKVAKRDLGARLGLGGKSDGDDPAALLERADSLWSQGQKVAATALYARLKDEFKLSLTYALNKDRIRDRAKYKEPPK